MTPIGIVQSVVSAASATLTASYFFTKDGTPAKRTLGAAVQLMQPAQELPKVIADIADKAERGKIRKAVRAGVKWANSVDDKLDDVVDGYDEAMPDDVRDAFGTVLVWASCTIAGVPYAAPKPKPDDKGDPVKPTVGASALRDLAPAGRGVEVVS